MLKDQLDFVKSSLKEIYTKNLTVDSFQTKFNCFKSAIRSCNNNRLSLYYLKSEKKMNKVVSYENLIKMSKKLKLIKLFLFNDDQRDLFNYCQTPYKIKDNKSIQDFENKYKIENPNQVEYKMFKYLKDEFEKII
jgi:hypothetical protein